MNTGLQQTEYINSSQPAARADFNKEGFDRLISEKGRAVFVESALQCPCKGEATNQLSTCRNCSGSGYIFVNKRETRMILSGVEVSTKFAPWSEEARGTVAITAMMEEELSYLDRITDKNGKAVFGEVLSFKQFNGKTFAYAAYDISQVLYAGLFVTDKLKLRQLTNDDYTINGNAFYLNTPSGDIGTISVTIRYKHAPTFHIIEFKRETMQSFKFQDGEEILQDLPISAFAKRAHYQMGDKKRANGTFTLNNDYIQSDDSKQYFTQINDDYNFKIIKGEGFEYTISIIEAGQIPNIIDRTYKLQVRNTNGALVTEFIMGDGIQIIAPNTVKLIKTPQQTASLNVGVYNYDLIEYNENSVDRIIFGMFIVEQQITI